MMRRGRYRFSPRNITSRTEILNTMSPGSFTGCFVSVSYFPPSWTQSFASVEKRHITQRIFLKCLPVRAIPSTEQVLGPRVSKDFHEKWAATLRNVAAPIQRARQILKTLSGRNFDHFNFRVPTHKTGHRNSEDWFLKVSFSWSCFSLGNEIDSFCYFDVPSAFVVAVLAFRPQDFLLCLSLKLLFDEFLFYSCLFNPSC